MSEIRQPCLFLNLGGISLSPKKKPEVERVSSVVKAAPGLWPPVPAQQGLWPSSPSSEDPGGNAAAPLAPESQRATRHVGAQRVTLECGPSAPWGLLIWG